MVAITTGQPTSHPSGQPSGQPSNAPSSYPTRSVRSEVELPIKQEVKGLTLATFNDKVKKTFIQAVWFSLKDQFPSLRPEDFTITGATEKTSRRLEDEEKVMKSSGRGSDSGTAWNTITNALGKNTSSDKEKELKNTERKLAVTGLEIDYKIV